MNAKRETWARAHGAIPKGWVIHALNGNEGDLRLENLAAIPRYPDHNGQITAPYRGRIKKLEEELQFLEKENATE